MSNEPQLITGNLFSDNRGHLSYFNEFSLKSIVRFYEIEPKDPSIIRAWQAHKEETKWFYCTHGAFKINLVKLDSFDNPSDNLDIYTFELNADKPQVLFIPGGFANGFKSLLQNSKLLVFSNFNLNESKQDDYRFETEKWITNW